MTFHQKKKDPIREDQSPKTTAVAPTPEFPAVQLPNTKWCPFLCFPGGFLLVSVSPPPFPQGCDLFKGEW